MCLRFFGFGYTYIHTYICIYLKQNTNPRVCLLLGPCISPRVFGRNGLSEDHHRCPLLFRIRNKEFSCGSTYQSKSFSKETFFHRIHHRCPLLFQICIHMLCLQIMQPLATFIVFICVGLLALHELLRCPSINPIYFPFQLEITLMLSLLMLAILSTIQTLFYLS